MTIVFCSNSPKNFILIFIHFNLFGYSGFWLWHWDLQSSLQHAGSSSWPGIKLRLPTLGAGNLSHWTTRQVPLRYFNTGLPFPCWWFISSVLPCSFPIIPSVTENCCIWCDFTIRTSLRLFFLMWTLAKSLLNLLQCCLCCLCHGVLALRHVGS